MQRLHAVLFSGVAALCLTGASAAVAQTRMALHDMTIQLPGGGVEHIEYIRDVAPKVAIAPAPLAPDIFWPASAFAADPTFAALDRVSAEMNRQMDALFRQAGSLASAAWSGTESAAVLPPGTMSYSMISTAAGNQVCTRSMQITASGNGGKPQVIRHSFGDCGAGAADTLSGPDAAPAPHPIPVNARRLSSPNAVAKDAS